MNILLVTSKEDIASVNFKKVLLKDYDFINTKDNLYYLNSFDTPKDTQLVQENKTDNKIFLKDIDSLHLFSNDEEILDENNYEIVIFLSKHSTLSKNGTKCFSAHAVGNFNKADLGGKDKTLVETDAFLIRYLLLNLRRNKPKPLKVYEVKQEATHHGPYLSKKTIFYEIGSNEEDWNNIEGIEYLSKILIYSLLNYSQEKLIKEFDWESVCGFGGSHYCTVFNRHSFNLNNKYCFGHIVPSYAIDDFKENNLYEEIKKKGFSNKILKEDLQEL
jgi:D-tyrosyl-tRNA(Tyr) deacylase